MKTATILITYNRPLHTQQVVDSLRTHQVDDLYVYCDAPKDGQITSEIQATRDIVNGIDWTQANIIVQEFNQGLAKSIIQALNHCFKSYDSVILLEDDCVPGPAFFKFMSECLSKYKNHSEVMGISGYSVDLGANLRSKLGDLGVYSCPRMGSWGWATWRHKWALDDRDTLRITKQALDKDVDFCQGGSDIPVFVEHSLTHELKDTWTLPWLLKVYLEGGIYIYPTLSHINNIGMDGSGVHCGVTQIYDTQISDAVLNIPNDPPEINNEVMDRFKSFYTRGYRQDYKKVLSDICNPHPLASQELDENSVCHFIPYNLTPSTIQHIREFISQSHFSHHFYFLNGVEDLVKLPSASIYILHYQNDPIVSKLVHNVNFETRWITWYHATLKSTSSDLIPELIEFSDLTLASTDQAFKSKQFQCNFNEKHQLKTKFISNPIEFENCLTTVRLSNLNVRSWEFTKFVSPYLTHIPQNGTESFIESLGNHGATYYQFYIENDHQQKINFAQQLIQGDLLKHKDLLQRFLEVYPEEPVLNYFLALIFSQTNNHALANEALSRARNNGLFTQLPTSDANTHIQYISIFDH